MKHIITGTLLIFVLFLSAQAASSAKKELPRRDLAGNMHAYESVGLLAMREIRWNWRPEGWVIAFGPGNNDYFGITDRLEKKIYVWISPKYSLMQVVHFLVHELTHVFDFQYITPELRAKYLAARKLPPDTPWYPPCNRCSDYAYGVGDFVESVSWTLQGPEGGFYSELGPEPDKAQQALIMKWLTTLPNMAGM
jgi:hypothetical protein